MIGDEYTEFMENQGCWRCIILNEPVSTFDIWVNIRSSRGNSVTKKLRAVHVSTIIEIMVVDPASFPASMASLDGAWRMPFAVRLPRLPPMFVPAKQIKAMSDLWSGWWAFFGQHEDFKARISYDGVSASDANERTVRDPWITSDTAMSPWEFRYSLCDFLQQFATIKSRWVNQNEAVTNYIIHKSAQCQKEHALRSTLMPTSLYGDLTIIALALRCLVVTREVDEVIDNWSTRNSSAKTDYTPACQNLRKTLGEGFGLQ